MEKLLSPATLRDFKAPGASLGALDAELAAKLISAAADVALIIDQHGVIQDVAVGAEALGQEGFETWIGRAWVDTVTVESRPKIEELLAEASAATAPRWRQVNHPSRRGPDIPVRYSALPGGRKGHVVALGRDLSPMATLQQQLVEAQLAMEREYSRLRHAETRYRLLFQIASEPMLVVDATTNKVAEANPAAGRALGRPAAGIVGRSVFDLFAPDDLFGVQALLSKTRASGRADGGELRLAEGGACVQASASMFRQEGGAHFLLRVTDGARGPERRGGDGSGRLNQLMNEFPEGFVVTRPDRRILTANRAFLDLAQLANEEHAAGEPLDRWLGRSGVDLNVMVANLREYGAVRNFPTVMRGEYGTLEEVEVSAVSVPDGEEPSLGFVVRVPGRRAAAEPRSGRQLPRSVEQLTELIGRVPLKDLVRETTDVIERLCIEAALQLTGDNRASAAQMLGLSRQSLYVKLRRYGLAGDAEPEPDEA